MAKRKQEAGDESDGSSSDVSLIDVDFDFFDPNPTVDYLALKRLITQLFQRDADIFHVHELAELILNQPRLGTTVKTDGMESDPYAFLTVLNMHVHHEHSSIKAIANYCLEKTTRDPAFNATLQALFSQTQHHVGFVFCERLINMPVQVIPHMYRMLVDELKRAINENEPYTFTHLLFISRTYHLSPDEESAIFNAAPRTNGQSVRKSKRSKPPSEPEMEPPADHIYSFHHEDEYIKKVSIHSLDYTFTTASTEPREKDAFGVENRGRMMLVPAERFLDLVATMSEVYAVR
ncbi:p21-C-terminal region-binding protein-domain-containing protein [Collybia nuda]|uniref:Protein BCP1 n=1 Tax=Collybia nuda TaxID=64659 RepID=A0A9P5YB86_9AGAR|nr:p21-C-terminal region-binding protein-domain-containing protein [Collybia nuda]